MSENVERKKCGEVRNKQKKTTKHFKGAMKSIMKAKNDIKQIPVNLDMWNRIGIE